MPHFEGLGGNLVIVARAPIEQVAVFGRDKGWKHTRLLSAARNSFRRDYGGDGPVGQPVPIMTVFRRCPTVSFDCTGRANWCSTDGSRTGYAAPGHCGAALDAVRPHAEWTSRN
jgi:predicted dithiol-disulfide oxidoreductase (DUF899 family)